jgi:hypothetical protein
VVCDRSGGGSDCGESYAVEICALVVTREIEEHSQEWLCHMELTPYPQEAPDPERSWLAHPPRQPGQTLREDLQVQEKVETA